MNNVSRLAKELMCSQGLIVLGSLNYMLIAMQGEVKISH